MPTKPNQLRQVNTENQSHGSKEPQPGLQIGQKVWLLDGESGDSECDVVYTITGVLQVAEPASDNKSSQSRAEPSVSRTPSPETTSPSDSDTSNTSFDTESRHPSPPRPATPTSPWLPMIITNAALSSVVELLPPTPPLPITDSSAFNAAIASSDSLSWHQISPPPDPDPVRIYLRSILDATCLRPRQPTGPPISSRQQPPSPAHCAEGPPPLGALEPGAFVYMIAPEGGSSPPFCASPPRRPGPQFYPASFLVPIRYRPSHILRVSGNQDPRAVTRVFVRGGRSFYDLVGSVPLVFPGLSSSFSEDEGRTRIRKEKGDGAAVEAQAEYRGYPERKLRRFRGDRTPLGEVYVGNATEEKDEDGDEDGGGGGEDNALVSWAGASTPHAGTDTRANINTTAIVKGGRDSNGDTNGDEGSNERRKLRGSRGRSWN